MNKKIIQKNKTINKFDITLISLTYNQADIVVEHLESILFQKIEFLNKLSVQLIISDDASKDHTVNIIKSWLEEKGHYFDSVKLLTAEINQGTSKSFVKSIKLAKGKYIKALAGDDLYLKTDLSRVFPLLIHNDIVLTPSLLFYDNDLSNISKLKFEKSKFAIKRYLGLGYEKIRTRLISAPETPGVFFNSNVFTDRVLGFMAAFDLIEDRSFWISVLEENEILKVGFQNEAYVGYRQHAASISKGSQSATTVRYKLDQKNLCIYQIKNCKSFVYKFVHIYNLYFTQVDFKFKRFFNFSAIWFNLSFYCHMIFRKS